MHARFSRAFVHGWTRLRSTHAYKIIHTTSFPFLLHEAGRFALARRLGTRACEAGKFDTRESSKDGAQPSALTTHRDASYLAHYRVSSASVSFLHRFARSASLSRFVHASLTKAVYREGNVLLLSERSESRARTFASVSRTCVNTRGRICRHCYFQRSASNPRSNSRRLHFDHQSRLRSE